MAVDVGSAVGYLDLDISGFLSGLQSVQSQADKMSQGIGKTLEGIGSSLKDAGTNWTAKITAPITALEGLSIKTAADFESQMSKVSAISGATGSDLEMLNEKAKEMGATTKFSASESAQAFQYMAMAGWDAEKMVDGISGIMNLAAADGLDLATTSDIVTDALTAFGLQASDGAHFADVLAVASSSANTNVSMLGESFKYVGPAAGAMGYSVEDVSVALGLMANSGIKAGTAGSTLRNVITNMAKPTDDMVFAMEKLGVTLEDADGNSKDFMTVMKDLRKGFKDLKAPTEDYEKWLDNLKIQYEKGMITEGAYYDSKKLLIDEMHTSEEAMKAEYAAMLAGKEGMSGLLAIVNASDEDFEKLTNNINNANGTAQRMADTMNNNLSGQITLLKSQLEGVAIEIGNKLLPIAKKLTNWVSDAITWFSNLNDTQKNTVLIIGTLLAAIGPLLIVIGTLISTVGKTITTYTNLAKNITTKLIPAITSISAPVLAIVAVIGVLIAAFINLWNNNEDFRNKIITLWEGLKNTFSEFIESFIEKIKILVEKAEPLIKFLGELWGEFCNLLAPLFKGAFKIVIDILTTVFDVILDTLDVFISAFSGDWQGAWDKIKNIFSHVWEGIKNVFFDFLEILKGMADVFLGWFGTSWNEVWAAIKDFFVGIWNEIYNFVIDIFTKIKNFFVDTWTSISDFFERIFSGIENTFKTIWNAIKNFFIDTWDEIIGRFSFITDNFKDLLNSIKNAFNEAWELIKIIWDKVVPYFEAVWESIKAVWDFVYPYFEAMWESIKDVTTKFLDSIKEFFTKAWESIKGVWDAVTGFFDEIWDNVKQGASETAESVNVFFSKAWDAIKIVWDVVTDFFGLVWEGIKKIYSEVESYFKLAFENAWIAIKTVFNAAIDFFQIIWDGIAAIFSVVKSVLTGDFSDAWESIKNVFSSVNEFFSGIWNGIKEIFSNTGDFFKDKFKDAVEKLESPFANVKDDFQNLWNSIKGVFDNVSGFFNEKFTGAVNSITSPFSDIRERFDGMWWSLIDSAKYGVNGIIERAENGINNIIDSLNHFGFELPEVMGGGWVGFAINYINLPRLEKGGILKKGQVGLLEGNGTEAVIPLEKNLGWIKEIAKGISNYMVIDLTPLAGMVEAYSQIMKSVAVSVNSNNEVIKEFIQDKPGTPGTPTGNTYIFNSPKPIDEYEAARQMKKAERDAAEGYYS